MTTRPQKPGALAVPLNERQEAFCREFVANGGNGMAAAAAAGYATPHVDGARCLANQRIAARVRQLVALDITSQLGKLVTMLLEIASDPLVAPRERINAINSLLDRGGLAVPKGPAAGPSVAVQVNVASTAGEAQAAIREVWESRTARQKALAMGEQGTGHALEELEDAQVIELEQEAGGVSYVGHANDHGAADA